MPILATCLSKQIAFYANTGILLNNKKIINYWHMQNHEWNFYNQNNPYVI